MIVRKEANKLIPVLLVGLVLGGCAQLHAAKQGGGKPYDDDKQKPPTGEQPPGTPILPTVSAEAFRDLSAIIKGKIRLVFTLDDAGNIQAFQTPGERAFHAEFPLHAGDLIEVKSITTFTTSNPKSCYKNGGGSLICVTW